MEKMQECQTHHQDDGYITWVWYFNQHMDENTKNWQVRGAMSSVNEKLRLCSDTDSGSTSNIISILLLFSAEYKGRGGVLWHPPSFQMSL